MVREEAETSSVANYFEETFQKKEQKNKAVGESVQNMKSRRWKILEHVYGNDPTEKKTLVKHKKKGETRRQKTLSG